MILRRLRLRAGVYVSAMLLLVGLCLVAGANEPITKSQAEAMMDARLAAAGVLIVGAFWTLVLWINNGTKAALSASIQSVERAVKDLTTLMKDHHEDPLAHPLGSANRIDPINEKLDEFRATQLEMAKDLAGLIAEHRVIRGTEDEVCAAIRALRARDPKDSPKPKRKTDSGVDYTPLRGKTP